MANSEPDISHNIPTFFLFSTVLFRIIPEHASVLHALYLKFYQSTLYRLFYEILIINARASKKVPAGLVPRHSFTTFFPTHIDRK